MLLDSECSFYNKVLGFFTVNTFSGNRISFQSLNNIVPIKKGNQCITHYLCKL